MDFDDGAIVELVYWRVPTPVPPSVHGLKYILFYGRAGVREVGYDNERARAITGTFRAPRRLIALPLSSS